MQLVRPTTAPMDAHARTPPNSPLAILAYMAAYTLPALAAALAAGGAAAGAVWALTHGRRELPPLTLGTSFAFGPALFALLGFVMGVLWIDTLASEVVGSITLLSTLCHIPSDLAGLTLLAWGNSLNDYFGNAALTAQGHPSMAITACFASPLFNILISLSLGFLAHFAKNGVSSLSVSLTPEVLLGCVFLALYNVAVIAVGVLNKFYIPRSFHLFARAWYGLYFLMACGLALLLPAGRTSSSRL